MEVTESWNNGGCKEEGKPGGHLVQPTYPKQRQLRSGAQDIL